MSTFAKMTIKRNIIKLNMLLIHNINKYSSLHSITSSKQRRRLCGCLSDVKLVATGFNGKTYKELDIIPSCYVVGLFRTRQHRQGDCQASSFWINCNVDNVTLRLSGTSFPPDRTAPPCIMFAI